MYRQNERDIAYVGQTDIDQVRYSELVLKLAKQQRSVTRSDVAELLHINPPQAHHILKRLVQAGDLKPMGENVDANITLKRNNYCFATT